MADNLRLPFSGDVILDSNGDPVSGAKITVYEAGTTTPLTVYSDAALTTSEDNPIVCNSAGVCPVRYVGTDSWKATFTDADDATLTNYTTLDNEPGALDTSSFLTGTVSPSRSIISKTGAYTTTADDSGKQINCDATGGDFTVTLLSAVTLGAAGDYVIKNVGESGDVTVATSGGQHFDNSAHTSHILNPGDSVTVRSDGANYTRTEAFKYTSGRSTITYAASITPSFTHPDGTDYQITLTGNTTINAPTEDRVGTRGTFTIIQDGTGNHEITWNSAYSGNVFIDRTANAVTVVSWKVRSSSVVDYWVETGRFALVAVLEDQKATTTDGGTATAGSWETRDLNTEVLDTIGVSISSSEFTLPAGTYWVEWSAPARQCDEHQTRLYDVTGATDVGYGSSEDQAGALQSRSMGGASISPSASNTYRIEHRVATTRATDGHGRANAFGSTEVYTRVLIYAR